MEVKTMDRTPELQNGSDLNSGAAPNSGREARVINIKSLLRKPFFAWAFYSVQALLIASVLTVQLGLLHRHLRVPIVFQGDTVYEAAIVKGIIDDGWWWHVRELAAPSGLDLAAVPILGNLDCAIIKLIAVFTHKVGLAINLYWFITIILAGLIATWCLQRLEVHRWVSLVLGTLYAFCPHIYYRHTSHLMLNHYLIPLIATIAILLALGRVDLSGRNMRRLLFTGCILIGFSYVYWAFFSCFMLATGGVIGALYTRKSRVLVVAGIAVALVGGCAVLNLLPSVWAWSDQPQLQKFASYKMPAEAELYGLKIRQLISPSSNSPWSFFRHIADETRAANFPLENENTMSRMGLIASLGFLLLVAIAVFWIAPAQGETMKALKATGALTIACILLATIGGFGSFFNLLVRPDIRCYNRISIFIVFFSLAAVGFVLTKGFAYFSGNLSSMAAYGGFLVLLLVVGIADQNEASILNAFTAQDQTKFRIMSNFVGQIEKSVPRDAMVYQLPQGTYGDDPGLKPAMWNAQEEPFLLSKSVRWSWPADSAESVTLGHIVEQLNPSALVDTLYYRGYRGVFIDRVGYADAGGRLISGIAGYLDRPPMESTNQRYAFFPLLNTVTKGQDNYVFGSKIVFSPGGNAARYIGEGWSCVGCVEGKASTMNLKVSAPAGDLVLQVHITPTLVGSVHDWPIRISVNGIPAGKWDIVRPDWYFVSIPYTVLRNRTALSFRFAFPNNDASASSGISKELGLSSLHFDAMVLAPPSMKTDLTVPTPADSFERVPVFLRDPGFEEADLSAWPSWLDVITGISSHSHTGKHSLAESGGAGSVHQDVSGLLPGHTYTVTAWLSGSPGTTAPAHISMWDPSTQQALSSTQLVPTQRWQLVTNSMQVGPLGTLRIHLFRESGSGTIFWDDVHVYQEH